MRALAIHTVFLLPDDVVVRVAILRNLPMPWCITSMRCLSSALRGLVFGLVLVSVRAALAAEQPLATELPGGVANSNDADGAALAFDRRFAEARALADQDQWPKAVRAAQSALELE